jgi:lipoprotein-anchoring transpeptidase ErfK/SrfK
MNRAEWGYIPDVPVHPDAFPPYRTEVTVTPVHPHRHTGATRAVARGDAGLARSAVLVTLAVVLAAVATGAVVLTGAKGPLSVAETPGPARTPAPAVTLSVAGARGTVVPWYHPLSFTTTHGTITTVTATGPDGLEIPGTLTTQSWVGKGSLIPGQVYRLRAVVRDEDGKTSTVERTVTASPPNKVLHATFTPNGGTYGIGQPLIVRFDQPIKGAEARRAVLQRLDVSTTPAVAGAWRWYNSFEAHYRGQAYWKPGTKVSANVNLAGLRVPGSEAWGSDKVATGGFSVGRALTGVVDIKAHTMTVKRDGKVVKVFKVSTGRAQYPTKGGVHIVLVREREHLYNSATIGIPTNSPDGYYHKLPYSVRISNGGAFVHANPATVRYQGSRNVSHGCVYMSVADARWFYENSLLGDVVDVVNAVVPPVKTDAGMADWNYSWDEWQKGNVDGGV